jgi:hypothetical protein
VTTSLIARLRTLTFPQSLVLTTGCCLVAIGLASLGAGRGDQALGLLFLLQMLLVVMVLLAIRRISQRINSSTGRVLRAVTGNDRLATQTLAADARQPADVVIMPGALPFYARINRKKQSELVRQLVLDRSLDGRDILACEASRGELDFQGLCVLLEAFRSPAKRVKARRIAERFDRDALLTHETDHGRRGDRACVDDACQHRFNHRSLARLLPVHQQRDTANQGDAHRDRRQSSPL